MMKSNLKRNVSGSGKVDVLSELQKQKEIILRDMEEQKRRKQREQEQKQAKVAPPPIVINERNVRDRTPPVIKKRVEAKSFAEVMREAELKSKQKQDISEIPLCKKKVNEINSSSLSSISIKRKSINEIKTDRSTAIPNKKLKLNDENKSHHSEKSKPKAFLPINSMTKHNSTLSVKSSINNRDATNSTKLNGKSNVNPKVVDRPPIKISNTVSQGSSKSAKCGILAQSSSRNSFPAQKQPSAKNLSNNNPKSSISNQNSTKNLVTSKSLQNSSAKISSQNSSSRKQAESKANVVLSNQKSHSKNHQSNNNSKSISNINSQNKMNVTAQNKKINKPVPSLSADRGICAQNGANSNRNNQNNFQKNTYSSGPPTRGIAAQSAVNSSRNYQNPQKNAYSSGPPAKGIAAQNAVNSNRNYQNPQKNAYSSGPPARGIAAQSAARGILAQSGNRLPRDDSYISDSEYDDEYDSDLDNFIDDTEDVVDESIKKEIYKSLNYDPNKYANVSRYDDCKNMVSRFDDICKEEIRSSKIGRQEDMLELKELERANENKMKMKSKYY